MWTQTGAQKRISIAFPLEARHVSRTFLVIQMLFFSQRFKTTYNHIVQTNARRIRRLCSRNCFKEIFCGAAGFFRQAAKTLNAASNPLVPSISFRARSNSMDVRVCCSTKRRNPWSVCMFHACPIRCIHSCSIRTTRSSKRSVSVCKNSISRPSVPSSLSLTFSRRVSVRSSCVVALHLVLYWFCGSCKTLLLLDWHSLRPFVITKNMGGV